MVAHETDVESEEHKELLIPLTHAVVDPGTVMVHLLDTSKMVNKVSRSIRQVRWWRGD